MLVTLDVSQLLMSRLKVDAPQNIPLHGGVRSTSHPEMSWVVCLVLEELAKVVDHAQASTQCRCKSQWCIDIH